MTLHVVRRVSFILSVALALAVLAPSGESLEASYQAWIAVARADACDHHHAAHPCNLALVERGEQSAGLAEYANDGPAEGLVAPPLHQRRELLAERARRRANGDPAGIAQLNSVLASEAFARAERVAARWLDRRDPRSGLFPHTLKPEGRTWTYGDAGSDLFPFLAITTRLLIPERYSEILSTLTAERILRPGLPADIDLDTGHALDQEPEKRMLGAVEYAKDGLLPMLELLGPDPWLGRLVDVMDAVIAASDVPTPRGPIPSPAAEVNGAALQALARLYWATGDARYVEMGRRIAAAYLEKTLQTTEYLPPHRWDFIDNEPIGPRRFFLGDHGNEVVAGLVEWHRVEVHTGAPEAAAHRQTIRKMLDRLLERGRTPDGLWYELIDVPSGRVRDKDLTDNWGYLGQAYLNQAEIERALPSGDLAAAERYEQAAVLMLRTVSTVDFYAWENGEMDGYADTLESALYLLRYLDVPEAAEWVDEQVGVLYGFQGSDGAVTDENIDGNFVRTTLLYGLAQTAGARLEPWTDGIGLGAVRDGDCLQVSLHAEVPWQGRLLFDTRRHRAFVGLPTDYPRLNQWPERWTVDGSSRYVLEGDLADPDGVSPGDVGGGELAAGLPVALEPGRAYRLRACPR